MATTNEEIKSLAKKIWPKATHRSVKEDHSFQWDVKPGDFRGWALVVFDNNVRIIVAAKTRDAIKAMLERLSSTEG